MITRLDTSMTVEVHYDMAGTVEVKTFTGKRVRYGILPDGRGWVQVDGRAKTAFGRVYLIEPRES